MIKKEFEFEKTSPVAICDVEIQNDIKSYDGKDWNYSGSDIITLGILYGNKISILQREKSDKVDYWKDELKKVMNEMPVMFAFNNKMEKGAIRGFIGVNRFFEEISVFRGKGCNKSNFFNDLVKNKIVLEEQIPNDPFKNNSELVIGAWKKDDYDSIIEHNKSCLIKEYYILMNRFWFLQRYKDKIQNGWFQGECFGE